MDGNESDSSDNGLEDLQIMNREAEHDDGSADGSDVVHLEHEANDERDNEEGDGSEADSEEEHFYDISIAASHSYLGAGLACVRGRSVVEAGWVGRVPALAHHGVLFPGETVPMLLPRAHDAALLVQAIQRDKLFGLLCPDEVGVMLSGYGVLCEVMMAGIDETQDEPTSITFKARAIHRFRLLKMPKTTIPLSAYARMRAVEVVVLPELCARDSLRAARLHSLDPLRGPTHLAAVQRRLRALDAAVTPWPLFVYEIFDYESMRHAIHDYFRTIMLEDKLPEDAVSLSFWVASNLALSAADRLALFAVDDALLRLHMEVHFIRRKSVLCCSSCMAQIARKEHIFPMSSEGVHSNYTNLGGYMHDILTVSEACNVETNGAPSAEYSWFPGYTWTVALCANCMVHVGWRFEAMKRSLRPSQFYGLCRNYVQPYDTDEPRPDP
ncbi:protein cereblon [Spodoptera frugiperda]|uniref:Protein cereblon n=1 Tax=Spodoptera frugiperda TaxID=7108 RepID=A0A9R0D722_SPOFR|nr:protein cereblon [Spodoptera frugiperda]